MRDTTKRIGSAVLLAARRVEPLHFIRGVADP